MVIRKCNKCNQLKSLDDFYKDKRGLYQYLCKDCSRKKVAEWSKKNKERKAKINHQSREKHLEKVQEYYKLKARELRAENPEVFRERVRKSYWKNPQSKLEKTRQWRQENPVKVNYYNHKYREMKDSNGGIFTLDEWFSLCSLYEFKCICCGKQLSFRESSPDHVIPVSLGGLNLIENIQPLCRSCNSRKRANFWDFRIHVFDSIK